MAQQRAKEEKESFPEGKGKKPAKFAKAHFAQWTPFDQPWAEASYDVYGDRAENKQFLKPKKKGLSELPDAGQLWGELHQKTIPKGGMSSRPRTAEQKVKGEKRDVSVTAVVNGLSLIPLQYMLPGLIPFEAEAWDAAKQKYNTQELRAVLSALGTQQAKLNALRAADRKFVNARPTIGGQEVKLGPLVSIAVNAPDILWPQLNNRQQLLELVAAQCSVGPFSLNTKVQKDGSRTTTTRKGVKGATQVFVINSAGGIEPATQTVSVGRAYTPDPLFVTVENLAGTLAGFNVLFSNTRYNEGSGQDAKTIPTGRYAITNPKMAKNRRMTDRVEAYLTYVDKVVLLSRLRALENAVGGLKEGPELLARAHQKGDSNARVELDKLATRGYNSHQIQRYLIQKIGAEAMRFQRNRGGKYPDVVRQKGKFIQGTAANAWLRGVAGEDEFSGE